VSKKIDFSVERYFNPSDGTFDFDCHVHLGPYLSSRDGARALDVVVALVQKLDEIEVHSCGECRAYKKTGTTLSGVPYGKACDLFIPRADPRKPISDLDRDSVPGG
jgi:hypothetical protein